MFWWTVGAGVAGLLWLVVGRHWWRDYKLGVHLARLTTLFERINRLGPIHAPSQITAREKEAAQVSIAFLRAFPRHVITRELLKNSIVAHNFGRSHRVAAIGTLMEALVEEDVALDAEEFVRSYGH